MACDSANELKTHRIYRHKRTKIKHIHRYTRSVWDLGLNVRHIDFMARRNDK